MTELSDQTQVMSDQVTITVSRADLVEVMNAADAHFGYWGESPAPAWLRVQAALDQVDAATQIVTGSTDDAGLPTTAKGQEQQEDGRHG